MPRKLYNELQRVARPIEGRMARAFVRSVDRMREPVSITELALALAAGSVEAAMRQFPKSLFEDSLRPVGTIARDAVLKGGQVGAKIVNDT